jgi:hypothetical protein
MEHGSGDDEDRRVDGASHIAAIVREVTRDRGTLVLPGCILHQPRLRCIVGGITVAPTMRSRDTAAPGWRRSAGPVPQAAPARRPGGAISDHAERQTATTAIRRSPGFEPAQALVRRYRIRIASAHASTPATSAGRTADAAPRADQLGKVARDIELWPEPELQRHRLRYTGGSTSRTAADPESCGLGLAARHRHQSSQQHHRAAGSRAPGRRIGRPAAGSM